MSNTLALSRFVRGWTGQHVGNGRALKETWELQTYMSNTWGHGTWEP